MCRRTSTANIDPVELAREPGADLDPRVADTFEPRKAAYGEHAECNPEVPFPGSLSGH